MDVCGHGPLHVQSTGAARYLATFIDDYSRLCHVVPLGYKSEAAQAIRATIRHRQGTDIILLEQPSVANKAAATEAEQANNQVSTGVPDSPSTVQEDNSEADSTGIDLGPTYSTDSEAEEEATQAATEKSKPAAEDTAATSAQETQGEEAA